MRPLAIAAAALATIAAIVVPLVLSGNSPTTGPALPGLSAGPSSVVKTPPTIDQIVAFHGLEISAPPSWQINATRCGTPILDTVVRDEGGVPACLISPPPRVSSVKLQVLPPANTLMQHVHAVTNAHGVHLDRGEADNGVTGVVVPDVRVLMFIDTISASQTEQIIDSIQLPDVDANGCAMRHPVLDPPAKYQPAEKASLAAAVIPIGARGIAICHYLDNWLASSTTVTGDQLTRLVRAADDAPPGFARPQPGTYAPEICTQSSAQGGEQGSGFVLTAHYPERPDVTLWVHIGFCGNLGITNGVRSGRLTADLVEAVATPLHTGVGFPGDLVASATPTSAQ